MRRWFPVLATLALVNAASAHAGTVTLEDCIRLALARAPVVRGAAFDMKAAAELVRAARAAYSPKLLAQGEYGQAEGFDQAVTNGGSTAALLTVETTLVDGGARAAQLAAARARLQSAAALERQRRADIAAAVGVAYATVLEARVESGIHTRSLQFLREALFLLERQEALGVVPRNDVLRAELAIETAEGASRGAAAQLETSLQELQVLTGTPLAAEMLVAGEVPPAMDTSDEAIDASPVVADARAAAEAARRDAEAIRSERRPQVMLTASAGALGVDPGRTFRDNAGGQFLVGLAVPLFDGGASAARVAAALATANSAEAALRQARQTITVELGRLRVEATRAQADLAAWRRAVPKAEENLSLMRARYFGGGNVRLLEVLDALAQLTDARAGAARARLAYDVAVATERQVVGEGIP